MTLREQTEAYRRILALADVSRRYSAAITCLLEAVGEVLERLEPDVRARLESALADTVAQITATADAIDAAVADLPEGRDGVPGP